MNDIITTILLVLIFLSLVIFFIVLLNPSKVGKNKVHFYVTRDKNGELTIWLGKPYRGLERWVRVEYSIEIGNEDDFFIYGLNKHDYTNLKWEDEPMEVILKQNI